MLGHFGETSTSAANDGTHRYVGGSLCGVEKTQRTVNVIFQCSADMRAVPVDKMLKIHNGKNVADDGHIISVEEPATCSYRIVFVTPLACQGVPLREDSSEGGPETPAEAMRRMDGKCVYRVEGWWQYELCFGRHLRQFHLEGDKVMPSPSPTLANTCPHIVLKKVVAEYYLGRRQKAVPAKELNEIFRDEVSQVAYSSSTYKNGTSCDLTDKFRETQVRVVCLKGAVTVLLKIQEVATCRYIATVGTPFLCNQEGFKVKKKVVRRIACKELDVGTN